MTREMKGVIFFVIGLALTFTWLVLLATGAVSFYIYLPIAFLAGSLKGVGIMMIFQKKRNRQNTLKGEKHD